MITREVERTRFYTGETVSYLAAETEWLFEQSITGESDTDRSYAAAGLVRAVLDVPLAERDGAYGDAIRWASSHLLSVLQNDRTDAGTPNQFVMALPPVEGKFDSVSTKATETNRPEIMKKLVTRNIREDKPFFVIGVGHGGVIVAADTYVELGEQASGYYPVRFSRHKRKDQRPVLADEDMATLFELASESTIIVIDDDRSFTGRTTVASATAYFQTYVGDLVGSKVFGATPVLGRHPEWFHPQIIDSNGTPVAEVWSTFDGYIDRLTNERVII